MSSVPITTSPIDDPCRTAPATPVKTIRVASHEAMSCVVVAAAATFPHPENTATTGTP